MSANFPDLYVWKHAWVVIFNATIHEQTHTRGETPTSPHVSVPLTYLQSPSQTPN